MQAWHTGAQQLATHLRSDLDASLLDLLVRLLRLLHGVQDLWRHARLAEGGHAVEPTIGLDAHDAGHDGHGDAARTAVLDKLDEHGHVEEHLGHNHVRARVHLGLEVVHLLLVVRVRAHVPLALHRHHAALLRGGELAVFRDRVDHGRMTLRIASHSDAKHIAILATNVLDKVKSAREPALDRRPLLLASRRIAAESEDVENARLLGTLQGLVQLGRLHVGASEVHVGRDADRILRLDAKVKRQVAGAATSAPRDIDVERPLCLHPMQPLPQIFHARRRARRVVFEGNERSIRLTALVEDVADLAGHGLGG
mmetsp:Transcript_22846/g.73532  ORF Transcript_22846/g.73532 Transcript_22846/m.73532 type:complete len:311 (+) Transcript_22846:353-1285(+)